MVLLITTEYGRGAWEWQLSFATLFQAKVVVKIFTNLLYVLQGSFDFPYLDVTTLSVGASTTQFPLGQLHLHRLLLYSSTQVVLPQGSPVEGPSFVPLVPLSVPAASSHSHRDASLQTEEAFGFSMGLMQLQPVTQAKAQLE